MRALVLTSLASAALLFSGCRADPNNPEHWEKAITGAKKNKERIRVLDELRESGKVNPAFLPMLHEQLKSQKHAEVRAHIAKILGELKDPSSVLPLADTLDLGNSDSAANAMNKEIATALGAIGDPKAEPTLLKLLKVKDHYTKIEGINALGALKAKAAVEPLMAVAVDEGEPFISKKAIQALGEIGDPRSVPALVKMMFKERRGISFYMEASYALYQIGGPAAEALLPVIKGEDKQILSWAEENNIIKPALFAKAAQVLGDLHEARAEKALLQQLAFDSDYLDVKLFVRMRMADALGRLRSRDAAKVLAGMLGEEESGARQEYIRALVRIGGREAIAPLTKSAAVGSWDAREPSMIGLAMLGDERELPAFEKLAKEEEGLTQAECKDNPDYQGCDKPAELVKKHLAAIEQHRKRLSAAQECKADASCWSKKLDDPEPGVRERAAFEIGRSGNAALVEALTARLTEKSLEARLAIILATHWLVRDSKDAARRAQAAVEKLDKQIAEEKGKTEFVKVNEDLRRLSVALKRAGG